MDPRHQIPVLQQGHAGQGRYCRPAENLAGAGTAGGNSEAEKRGQVPAGVELVTGRSAGLRLHHAGVGLQGPVHPAGQNHLLQPGFAAGRQLHESVTG
ncbi:hypothetical protein D3C72_2104590 [compost metagenome]